ncbi:MAG: hypothetical protein ACJ796_05025 [Gemmatimonadaceae bacterium]
MNYYRLHDKNQGNPDRWYLGSPVTEDGQKFDAQLFLGARPMKDLGLLRLPMARTGAAQDFTMGPFNMPVLATHFVSELQRAAPRDFQAFPVIIEGERKEYSIINVLHRVRCVDESRTTVVRWPFDPTVPHLDGVYLTLSDIHIDPAKVGLAQMFRIDGWPAALIVSEAVGAVLAEATGVALEPV